MESAAQISSETLSRLRKYTQETKSPDMNTESGLPQLLHELTDNKAYWPKIRKRYRDYPREMMVLAELAKAKATKPSHYFSKATRLDRIEDTIKYVRNVLLRIEDLVKRIATKLSVPVSKYLYKMAWKNINIERWSDLAIESGRNKIKYFSWLCQQEAKLSSNT